MKRLLLAAVAILMAATLAPAQTGTGGAAGSSGRSEDEAAIRKLAELHAAAWNKGDARQAASVFAEDAAFTLVDGRTLKGRSAIEQNIASDPIGTARTGRTMTIDTEAVRFLGPDLAISNGYTKFSGPALPADQIGHYMAVVKKTGSGWKVLAVQAAVNAPMMERAAAETASMTAGTSGSSAADEDAIEALERDWLDAIVKADVTRLDRILTDDFIEVGPGGQSNDKAASLAETKKGDMVFESITLDDAKTRVFGDTALLVGTGTVKAAYKGQDMSGTYRWTDAFVKRNGRWQAVSGHVTRVMEEK